MSWYAVPLNNMNLNWFHPQYSIELTDPFDTMIDWLIDEFDWLWIGWSPKKLRDYRTCDLTFQISSAKLNMWNIYIGEPDLWYLPIAADSLSLSLLDMYPI